MSRYLVVVDMQNDFVEGVLGTEEARKIISSVVKKIKEFPGRIIYTKDTHGPDYLFTQEGRLLPVPHCIADTYGGKLICELEQLQAEKPVKIYDLACDLIRLTGLEPNKDIKIEVTGLRPGEKLYEELLMNEEGLTETKHKKIFIGKPGDFDINDIAKKTDELLMYASKGSKVRLKKQLKSVVDTFKEPEEVNSKIS